MLCVERSLKSLARAGSTIGACLLAALVAGCNEPEQISRYQVLKPSVVNKRNPGPPASQTAGNGLGERKKSVDPAVSTVPDPTPPAGDSTTSGLPAAAQVANNDRMLAAIMLAGPQAWFFKLTATKEEASAQEAAFEQFLKSVEFDKSEPPKPKWKLPEGWTEQGGSGFRYATLRMGDAGKVELSVTMLSGPTSPELQPAYMLDNINRWRGQMAQPPLKQADLAKHTRKVETAGGTATVVDIIGTAKPTNMGRGPFMQGAGNGK